jgi:two-component system, OmpR family, copper resistance phosphate regulon response regulator CusR
MRAFTDEAPPVEDPFRRILIVDDEPRIVDFVSRGLRREGFDVAAATDGKSGLERAVAERFDLVILDLLMPGLDGMSVLRGIVARRPDQPVLVLSALSDIRSKVESLEIGADDYLAKPFSFSELLARVHARLRTATRNPPASLTVGRLRLDLLRRSVDAGWGPVPLAEREFLLLKELMRHPGTIVSKERLLEAVWGYRFDPASNVLDVCVRRLRSKLGADVITTVRGAGYRVDDG